MTTMPSSDDCSCPDYKTSRRAVLRTAALGSAGAMATTMFGDTFRQTAFADMSNGNVLVVLSLRGGADFMSMVVPHGDPAYYEARPHIAIQKDQVICGDGSFGLHPAFRALKPMWDAKKMGVVVATGLPAPNRSHFEAIEEIEDADLGSAQRSGWINRLVGLDTFTNPLEAVSVGSGLLPTSLFGTQPALATDSTENIGLSGGKEPAVQVLRRRALTQLWGEAGGPLGRGARDALSTSQQLAPALSHAYNPAGGANYPSGTLGDALKDTARLIKAEVGVEVVTLDYGTWDMHSNVGTPASTGGASMAGMVSDLATSLAAFFADLGATGNRVTVVTMTEFGRRLTENGSRGLDHGWANSTLVLGGGVKGGQYYGSWPGLSSGHLEDGDLAVTTDYRSVLTEILAKRFQVSSPKVFPGFVPEAVGAMA